MTPFATLAITVAAVMVMTQCGGSSTAPTNPPGVSAFTLIVKLKVRDDLRNVSDEATHGGVRLFPQGSCGF